MKDKIKVFLDCDGTLINTPKQCIKMINNEYGVNADYRAFKKYNFQDVHKDINITNEFINSMFESEEFFEEVEFFEEALNVLRKYNDKFSYEITTIGTELNLKRKDIFFKKHIDFDYNTNFIVGDSMGKGMVDMSNSIIIDDHIKNILTSNAKFKILYADNMRATEWNDYLKDIDGYIVSSWSHIDDILGFISEIGDLNF